MIKSHSNVKYALKYAELDWFVLPIHPDEKKPLVKWANRKDQRPPLDEIQGWYEKWPNARVGIVTGRPSGADAVDLDGTQAQARFEALFGIPETIMQTTGRKDSGLHLFFKHNGHGLRNVAGKGENKGIDLRTDGGIVVVAPSTHPSGNRYQWLNVNPLEDGLDDLLEMPADVIEFFKKQNGENRERKLLKLDPVAPGARNDTLARLVGKWVHSGMDLETAYLTACGWNSTLPQPLDEKEVKTTVESIFKTHERNHPGVNDQTPPGRPHQALRFPEEAITGVAGRFARLYGHHLEAPVHFFFMCFLTCLGSVLGKMLTLATEINPQPRLFTIILGESADDRKSTAIKKTVQFFKSTMESFPICWGVGSAEGLQKRLLQSNSLLLCLDEFKQFVGKCRIEASVLLPCVNTLFESNDYESWTKKSEICLQDVYLSMLAASTIQTYERTWDSSFTDIGFNNRLFLVPGSGEKKHSFPNKVPDHKIEALKEEVAKVLKHASYNQELDLTDEAKERFHQWYLNLDRSIHAKRLDAYALRLMALLAVNELKSAVDTETANKVLAICDWQLEVRQIHDPIDADNETAKMEEKIRRVLKREPRTDRELKQYTHAKKTGLWVYNRARQNLLSASEIQWRKEIKKYVFNEV
jgi:hypothetical protein